MKDNFIATMIALLVTVLIFWGGYSTEQKFIVCKEAATHYPDMKLATCKGE